MFPSTDTSPTNRPGAVLPTTQTPERSLAGGQQLSKAEQRKLDQLKATDARVRRHEEAHRAAAGALYRGGPSYTYETGPDGKRYAVAGSVQIDTSPGRTPEETMQKASAIRRAALAPTDPSATDRAVAAKASRMEAAARRALAKDSMQAAGQAADTKATAKAVPTQAEGPLPVRAPASDETWQVDAVDASKISPETLAPGDLGGEVWSVVSDLARSESLRHERRSEVAGGPGLDVLA